MSIPTKEPDQITAGDYVQWKIESSDVISPAGVELKASAGWTLTYALTKTSKAIAITALWTPRADGGQDRETGPGAE